MSVRLVLVALTAFACREPEKPDTSDPVDPDPTTPPTGTTPTPTPTTTTTTPPAPTFARPVVSPKFPLALANPQQDTVSWPIWGGAFTLGETVSIRAAMDAPVGDAGLVIAGPGAVRDRVAVELLEQDGAWALRETLGGDLVQAVVLDPALVGEVVLELQADQVRVIAAAGELSMTLTNPLASGEAGLYAWLAPGAELSVTDLAMTQPLPSSPELGTPLRELAAAHGVRIGSATDIWPPVHDLGFEAMFGEHFDLASPTEFYWPTTRGEDEDFFFVPADLMVNYALVHDQQLTGMFLVWDFALPAWVEEVAYTQGSKALGQVYDEHITTLVDRYEDHVDTWVVVNEAIWGPGEGGPRARFAQTLWYDFLGEEHIERAFHVARAADPDAVLMYNETGAEVIDGKSDFMYDMAADFVARKVPIDAVGFQFHVHADDPPDPASVIANFERFAALGLDIYITELDVSLEGVAGTEQERLDLQAAIYVDVLEACLAVPACEAWTVFGFSDRYAWDELGDATPLLFTEDYEAKPAFFEVQAALQ